MKKVLVIGAGFGGLAAAAELSRQGYQVNVLEAHTYPGGSAGTFYHQGYQFDAGATLAGGFAPGAVMDRISHHFNIDWQPSMTSKAMLVHLKDGTTVTRWTNSERWKEERIERFGEQGESFWDWQETTADVLWNFALRLPPWPLQSTEDFSLLAKNSLAWLKTAPFEGLQDGKISFLKDAFRTVSSHLPHSADKLRWFVDGQLLISAQTTSGNANALYGSVALDLARQGVAIIPGGMGGMAKKLVAAIRNYGGEVLFHQEVMRVVKTQRGKFLVQAKQKHDLEADVVIFNMPPWNITRILKDSLPSRLRRLPEIPGPGWGAFMLYVGLDGSQIAQDLPLHHQVIMDEPLGEGNSIFMSLSPEWDHSRAPQGKRALTISTHTNLATWWRLFDTDRVAYEDRKEEYAQRLLEAAECVLPGLNTSAELILPGTPITFQRFTRRYKGWVGGFPQTSLFSTWGPRLSPGLWMVGDAIFPGQSVPAVMLSGLRVAQTVSGRELLHVQGGKNSRPSSFDRLLNTG
ncbi:MAG: phytoene desaturase family protein [Anaerolineales bacterium]|jgi:C-3',4' desaturase CrtD